MFAGELYIRGQRALDMLKIRKLSWLVSTVIGLAVAAHASLLSSASAEMKPWQLGVPDPVSPVAVRIHEFHDYLLWLITAITIFVLALLVYVCFRFKASRNPNPSKTTHNTTIEVLWTVVPVLILVVVAVPSFKTLYYGDRAVDPDMTIKVTANQWYWTYEYPDHGNFTFDANIVTEEDIAKDSSLKRNMDTDERVVLPVGKKIQLLMTADDVLHNWGIPAFGIKLDTVPGRLNETWVQINKPGVYYGFCSELCGVNHAYMPITVEAVSPAAFEKWVKQAQKKYAKVDGSPPSVDVAKNVD